MRRPRLAWALFPILVWGSVCCAQTNRPPEDPWAPFDLQTVEVAGIKVRYEKALAAHRDALCEAVETFHREALQRTQAIRYNVEQTEQLVAATNKVLGFSAPPEVVARQRGMLDTVLKTYLNNPLLDQRVRPAAVIVTEPSLAKHLRGGGTVPGCTYDPKTGKLTLHVRSKVGSQEAGAAYEVIVSVPADKPVERVTTFLDSYLKPSANHLTGIGLQMAADYAISRYLATRDDPHFQWYSCGFAYSVAAHTLRERFGEEAIADFVAAGSTKQYEGLQKQLNLRYWPAGDWIVETPLESEDRLSKARNAFAKSECSRIVDEHGIGVVAKIFAKTSRPEAPMDVEAAIKDVTGIDMKARLDAYQDFGTREDGIRRYETELAQAERQEDTGRSLVAVLRLIELRPLTVKNDYLRAAVTLHRLGHPDAADGVFLQLLKLAEGREAIIEVHKLFIGYAAICDDLRRAIPSHDVVLAAEPDYVPAMAIRMGKLMNENKRDEAVQFARRILVLTEGQDTPWRYMAQRVIDATTEKPEAPSP